MRSQLVSYLEDGERVGEEVLDLLGVGELSWTTDAVVAWDWGLGKDEEGVGAGLESTRAIAAPVPVWLGRARFICVFICMYLLGECLTPSGGVGLNGPRDL